MDRAVTQAAFDRGDYLVWIDRLAQHAGKVVLVERAAFTGDDNDGNPHPLRRHFTMHVASVQTRQAKIEDDGCRRVGFEVAQRVDAVFYGNDGIAGVRQGGSKKLACRLIVFDHQHEDTGPGGGCGEHTSL